MSTTLTVVFDGGVFRPTTPVDLEPNTRCVVSILSAQPGDAKVETAWEVLDRMTGVLDGPGDWAEEHDHYLYGTPKRRDRGET